MTAWQRFSLVGALIGLAFYTAATLAEDDPPQAEERSAAEQEARDQADAFLRDELLPLTKQFCFKCHSGEDSTSGLRLDQVTGPDDLVDQRDLWEKALVQLRDGTMPPEGEDRPDAEVAKKFADKFEGLLTSLACYGPRDPGRVTIRRLNRVEYNNTIRDLVGIDFHPADDFPSDDVGYGFDNIGDVLTLSPVLLERYLAAAEEISRRAIAADDPRLPRRVHLEAEEMKPDFEERGAAADSVYYLYSNGDLYAEFEAPIAGTYAIRARAFGHQAGEEPARMELISDADAKSFDVEATEDEPQVYDARFEMSAGRHRLAVRFTNDYSDDKAEDEKLRGDRNLVVDWLEIDGPLGLEPGERPASHEQIIFVKPEPDTIDGCARQILKKFAGRAWRRPATSIEVSRLVRFVEMAMEQGEPFERGIQLAMQAVLVSPHFLFRVELPPGVSADEEPRRGRKKPQNADDETQLGAVGDWALASRLSYFLWSSMPDDELFALAEEEKLHEPEVLAAQAKRMLADPKSRALVENFAGQWLQLRNLSVADPDRKRFPGFDDELRAAMRQETELFFASIIREDRSILDFLDADYTYLNERLARHYGIDGVTGPEFRRVSLKDTPRGGVLTQASVLTVTSNPTRTSPVKRGRWVLEQILGTPPPPPPPGVPQLADDGGGPLVGTLRERMEQHRSNPDCAVCHQRMDPLGFGLENFDAVGAWREHDGDAPVDASGELPDGRSFSGSAGLREILVERRDDFRRCLTQKLLTYALGRGLESDDRCTAAELAKQVAAADDRFSALVEAIVTSEPFLLRHYPSERKK